MTYLLASETIRIAKSKLYPRDFAVVWRVCVQGLRVDQCGYLFAIGRAGREEAGRALRRGLGELAEMWWPEGKARRTRVYRQQKPAVSDAETTEAAKFYCAG